MQTQIIRFVEENEMRIRSLSSLAQILLTPNNKDKFLLIADGEDPLMVPIVDERHLLRYWPEADPTLNYQIVTD